MKRERRIEPNRIDVRLPTSERFRRVFHYFQNVFHHHHSVHGVHIDDASASIWRPESHTGHMILKGSRRRELRRMLHQRPPIREANDTPEKLVENQSDVLTGV